jgi:hypothetical protein
MLRRFFWRRFRIGFEVERSPRFELGVLETLALHLPQILLELDGIEIRLMEGTLGKLLRGRGQALDVGEVVTFPKGLLVPIGTGQLVKARGIKRFSTDAADPPVGSDGFRINPVRTADRFGGRERHSTLYIKSFSGYRNAFLVGCFKEVPVPLALAGPKTPEWRSAGTLNVGVCLGVIF